MHSPDIKAHTILPEQLCVGLYIHLDLPWIKHPFPFPSFKISSPEQIATIRSLGLKEIRYSPAKSDAPPPAVASVAASIAASGAAVCAPAGAHESVLAGEDATVRAKQKRIKRLASQSEKIAACEREFLNTTRQMKVVRQNLFSRPDQVCSAATETITRIADSMLVDAELSIHLISDKVAGTDVFNHALNVALLSMVVGKELKLPSEQIKLLGIGALLHDIGQAEIPGHIKNKTTPLSGPEAALLREHCARGVALGKQFGLPAEALVIIAQHHERIDGSGYPKKLSRPKLSLLSRIVAVIETYEELCNPLHGGRMFTPHEALSLIYGQQKKQLDETVVTAFIHCLSIYPPGTLVLLSNGVLGVVTSVNSAQLLKPTVMIYDAAASSSETILVDLAQDGDVTVNKTLKPQQLPPEISQFFASRRRVAYYFSSDSPTG